MADMNPLDRLKQDTTVVADTGDFRQPAAFAPRDATPNRSPILKALKQPAHAPPGVEAVAAAHAGPADPGVKSVADIHAYYEKFDIATELMVAGDAPLPRALPAEPPPQPDPHAVACNQAAFRCALNGDAMATEQLAESVRAFAADAAKLDALITHLAASPHQEQPTP